jgi:hypothetical protein
MVWQSKALSKRLKAYNALNQVTPMGNQSPTFEHPGIFTISKNSFSTFSSFRSQDRLTCKMTIRKLKNESVLLKKGSKW